jgi:nicotinamide mononucleotide transporter
MEMTDALQWTAVVLSLCYVVLAARQSIWCWPFAFLSSSLYVFITCQASLVGESFLQLFYVFMAVFGWWKWQAPGRSEEHPPLTEWSSAMHVLIIAGGLVLSLVLGLGFEHIFGSAMPYLDALTSVFSLIATFMLTRKVLSNWLYWIAIDALNVYLYWNRDLGITAGLYALYSILALWGFIQWRKTWAVSHSS